MDGVLRWRRSSEWGWRGGAVTATDRAVEARLDRALRRLESLARQPAASADRDRTLANGTLRCITRPPAAPETIDEAELRLGVPLPRDYRRLLLRTNGATLVLPNTDNECVELLGTDALVEQAEGVGAIASLHCVPEWILFATIDGDGDRLAFDVSRMNPFGGCSVLDARPEYRPDQWWVVACDFTSWLQAMLRATGRGDSFGRAWALEDGLQLLLPELDDTH